MAWFSTLGRDSAAWRSVAILATFTLVFAFESTAAAASPNIVTILADDKPHVPNEMVVEGMKGAEKHDVIDISQMKTHLGKWLASRGD